MANIFFNAPLFQVPQTHPGTGDLASTAGGVQESWLNNSCDKSHPVVTAPLLGDVSAGAQQMSALTVFDEATQGPEHAILQGSGVDNSGRDVVLGTGQPTQVNQMQALLYVKEICQDKGLVQRGRGLVHAQAGGLALPTHSTNTSGLPEVFQSQQGAGHHVELLPGKEADRVSRPASHLITVAFFSVMRAVLGACPVHVQRHTCIQSAAVVW